MQTDEREYSVVVVGMGKRGKHHAAAFHANPTLRGRRASATSTQARLAEAAAALGADVAGRRRTPPRWPRELKPDVFCFCTLPNLRADMIRIGVESGAKLIAFEKPVADSSADGHGDQEAAATTAASRPSSATSTATARTTAR